jgi:Cu(I)/Ag(I) efflux system periplasmic protein CusF
VQLNVERTYEMKAFLIPLAIAAVFATPLLTHASNHAPAQAAHSHDHGAAYAEGEVRRVDREAKKITIRHGHIANLDMPPMTMVFQVKDPAMVEKVKPGDKIRFSADKVNGAYTVTALEAPQ